MGAMIPGVCAESSASRAIRGARLRYHRRMGSPASPNSKPPRRDAAGFCAPLIRRIVDECPRRLAGTASERRAHDLVRKELDDVGCQTRYHLFSYNTSLYAVMALHFGVALLGTVLFFWSPALALVLHALAAISYFGDSTRRFHLLRRLFPYRPSRNLVGTLPARAERPSLRVVLVAHIDAAFTGVIFNPDVIRIATKPVPIPGLRWLRKQLLVATGSVALLALVDVITLFAGVRDPSDLAALVWILTIPSILTCVLNLEVVLRNHVVPGANDNLTGSTSAVVLAERLRPDKPDDVELVFVVTGAEEAGTGGAYALARGFGPDGDWDTSDTLVMAIDGFSNGEMRYMLDGEVLSMGIRPWLRELIEAVAAHNPRYAQVQGFEIPSGATDTMPFLAQGFAGVGLGCVDPVIGAPRHYHHPSDTPENLDLEQLALSIDFVEDVVRAILRDRPLARARQAGLPSAP